MFILGSTLIYHDGYNNCRFDVANTGMAIEIFFFHHPITYDIRGTEHGASLIMLTIVAKGKLSLRKVRLSQGYGPSRSALLGSGLPWYLCTSVQSPPTAASYF